MLVTGDKTDVRVLGAYGTKVKRLPNTWKMKRSGDHLTSIRYERDVSKAADLVNHPIMEVVPVVKSFLAVWAPENARHCYCLLALDPDPKAVADRKIMDCVQSMLCSLKEADQDFPTVPGFAEHVPQLASLETAVTPEPEPVSKFLLSTLIKQRRLHTRNNIDFVSLRRWRTAIKPFQIEALKAAKASPCPELVEAAAIEIAEHAKRQFGATPFKHVIPVPCGSSGKKECLSTLLARSVAGLIGAAYSPVLINAGAVRQGSSHPRKSSRLPGYTCETLPDGPFLLIDDVVTSGKHLEMAANALKPSAQLMLIIAWLGME